MDPNLGLPLRLQVASPALAQTLQPLLQRYLPGQVDMGPEGDIVLGRDIRLPLRAGALLDQLRVMINLRRQGAASTVQRGDFTLLRWPPRLTWRSRLAEKTPEKIIELTDKEVGLLTLLWQAGAPGVMKEKALAEVWGHRAELETHTLETHVYRLRRKLDELTERRDDNDTSWITAVEGGYAWQDE